jgi:hypothetical protein
MFFHIKLTFKKYLKASNLIIFHVKIILKKHPKSKNTAH